MSSKFSEKDSTTSPADGTRAIFPTIAKNISIRSSSARRSEANYFGLLDDWFIFLDNNLGGSPRYLRELCNELIPLKKTCGCALTFNILRDEETVKRINVQIFHGKNLLIRVVRLLRKFEPYVIVSTRHI